MSALITACGVGKRYGETTALEGVDFEVEPGRIVGLIGPNGAGKTTLLKALLGLTPCDGRLEVMGLDPFRRRKALMRHVSFVADVAVLPGWCRVERLLEYVAATHPGFSRERAEALLERTDVRRGARVRELSKGMIAQLHLSIVMAIDARLLILDEPTLGLDILFRKDFYTTLLNDYFDERRTILVTTHQVEEIEHILTDVMFISRGRLVLHESAERLAERYVELMTSGERARAAEALGPIYEREAFGKRVLTFEDVNRGELDGLGETRTPAIADLFVAKLRGRAA